MERMETNDGHIVISVNIINCLDMDNITMKKATININDISMMWEGCEPWNTCINVRGICWEIDGRYEYWKKIVWPNLEE